MNCECMQCGEHFHRKPSQITRAKKHFCSKECRNNYETAIIQCDSCGATLKKPNHKIKNTNFCNMDCLIQSMKRRALSDEEIISLHKTGLEDKQIAEQAGCTRATITYFLNKQGFVNRRAKKHKKELCRRISASLKGKMTGCNHPSYKGNSPYKKMARGIFNTLSKAVMLERNYICQSCGRRGGNLHTHHIKPFSIIVDNFLQKNPNILKEDFTQAIQQDADFMNKNNLVVVCANCHKNIHSKKDNHELSPFRWESATTIENTSLNDGSE